MQVTGICDKDLDKAAELQKEYGVDYITQDYRDLVEDKAIDIVAVSSPDQLHAEHCSAALEKSKHVICTKPLVTNLKDAKKLVKLVEEKKVKFLVGQTMRYGTPVYSDKKNV
ncbi:MAG: Gfo/Idh/MocA family oxidoreductase [Actinomycetota bacterium]|nr:Gfo/Idh/MocA family oxidoreductase [Actinomycetota bacterium]